MKLMDYLPTYLQETREFKKLFDAGDIEYAKLWQEVNKVFGNQFVYDASIEGVECWERMLSIKAKDTDTLDDRKFRIITTLNSKVPYTYQTLNNQLLSLLGKGNYIMSFKQSTFTLTIRIALTVKKQVAELKEMILKMIPANIILNFDLLYNTHETLSVYTHQHLAEYTQDALRNEPLD